MLRRQKERKMKFMNKLSEKGFLALKKDGATAFRQHGIYPNHHFVNQ
jgi:hypothetical protein